MEISYIASYKIPIQPRLLSRRSDQISASFALTRIGSDPSFALTQIIQPRLLSRGSDRIPRLLSRGSDQIGADRNPMRCDRIGLRIGQPDWR